MALRDLAGKNITIKPGATGMRHTALGVTNVSAAHDLHANCCSVALYNLAAVDVFVSFDGGAAVAASDWPLLAGTMQTFDVQDSANAGFTIIAGTAGPHDVRVMETLQR